MPDGSLAPLPVRREKRHACPACDVRSVTRPRPSFAGAGLVLAIVLTLVLIAFSALIGPFIMFTLPFILIAGFAIGPLYGLATAPITCKRCGRALTRADARVADR